MRPTRLLAALLAPAAFGAQAATFEVTTTADTGQGSLRAAITAANSTAGAPHTIVFTSAFPLSGTVTLQSALPALGNGRLTIDGNGRGPTLSGNAQHRIFLVSAGATTLELRRLILINGRQDAGGCVAQDSFSTTQNLLVTNTSFGDCVAAGGFNFPRGGAINWESGSGLVDIADSVFTANSAGLPANATAPAGGAIYASGNLRVVNSRFSLNAVRRLPTQGGGFGGAIYSNPGADISIVEGNRFQGNTAIEFSSSGAVGGTAGAVAVDCSGNCTAAITGNYFRDNGAGSGGALFIRSGVSGARATGQVDNNTFVGNQALQSGGAMRLLDTDAGIEHNTFFNNTGATGAHLSLGGGMVIERLVHNAFAATASGTACALQSNTPATVNVINLYGDTSCAGLGAAGAVAVSDFGVLGVDDLQRIGVVRFVPNSPVIDAVTNANECTAFDARGTARPLDGNDDGIARCDIGAFEHASEVLFRNGFEPAN
jgi:hypothetical protein